MGRHQCHRHCQIKLRERHMPRAGLAMKNVWAHLITDFFRGLFSQEVSQNFTITLKQIFLGKLIFGNENLVEFTEAVVGD